jgi:protein-tyrosine phosphatase
VTPGFVDIHSHVVPSGDDGAQTVAEAIALCRAAAEWGTRILFATPHVWPDLVLDEARERATREAFARVRPEAGLELRLGFELTPSRALLREDIWRYELEGTAAVLMEVPFAGPAGSLIALAEHAESAGLQPVIAHPERSEAVRARPHLADELADRGWLLQVNGTSLLGRHGERSAVIGWDLLERDRASLVGSDGHRAARPARLDDAYVAAVERLGPEAARFFDGSALGLAAAATARIPSHGATTGA